MFDFITLSFVLARRFLTSPKNHRRRLVLNSFTDVYSTLALELGDANLVRILLRRRLLSEIGRKMSEAVDEVREEIVRQRDKDGGREGAEQLRNGLGQPGGLVILNRTVRRGSKGVKVGYDRKALRKITIERR